MKNNNNIKCNGIENDAFQDEHDLPQHLQGQQVYPIKNSNSLETLDSFKTSTSLEDLEANKEQENCSGAKKKSPINGINTVGGKTCCALPLHFYHILPP